MAPAPTAEQEQAAAAFAAGGSLAIEAGAGTGKTTTLQLLAQRAPGRRGCYVAFNRAIVDEAAAKFPGRVLCTTAHSLAYRATPAEFAPRLRDSRRMKPWDLAALLDVDPLVVQTYAGVRRTLGAPYLAGLVMRGIERFCQTADEVPTWRHVPYIKNLDEPLDKLRPVNREVARWVQPAMQRAWADLSSAQGVLPYQHSHYLKAYQLRRPTIGAEYILFDEAQDASPVMVAIMAHQQAQLVWVGDSQQQIYSFTGAVNAMAQVPAQQHTYLTQSFRFGPPIADVANTLLRTLWAPFELEGAAAHSSMVGPCAAPAAILCRTNAEALRNLMRALNEGRRTHLVGGTSEIERFVRGAQDLQAHRRSSHPDLACFDSWGEVADYVAHDEQGSDLQLLVALVDQFGCGRLLQALGSCVAEGGADVVVSTAHKAKGREWDSVQLASDFPELPRGEELRLMYVACTRARRHLDITNVAFLQQTAVL